MFSTTFALLGSLVVASGGTTYRDAFDRANEEKIPLVVVVTTDWCPGCVALKSGALARLTDDGTLDQVAFAVVDYDKNPKMARKLMKGGSIPQIIMYTPGEETWKRKQLTGNQSTSTLRGFLERGIEMAAAVRDGERRSATKEGEPASSR